MTFSSHIKQRILVTLVILAAGLAVLHWHREVPLLLNFRDADVPYLVAIDSDAYLAMAAGHVAEVESPFSKRWLHPFLVRQITAATGLPLATGFLLLNILSFAVLAYAMAACLEITTGISFPAIPLLLTPFVLESLELGYLSDLFHMALLSLFFLLLLKNRTLPALTVLWVAFMARESTLVLCVCAGFLAYLKRDRQLGYGTLVVLVLGLLLGSVFGNMGKPNIHHWPDFFYMVIKIPYNFLANVCGIVIWSDLKPQLGVPLVKWPLPDWLRFGADREIGLIVTWQWPCNTLIMLLTLFGVAPVLALKYLKRWREMLALPLAIQIAFFYGVLSYLLGTSVGNWTERLIGHGWPAFWIALPFLLHRSGILLSQHKAVWLPALYVATCWLPALLGYDRFHMNPVVAVIVIPHLITCYQFRNDGRAGLH